MAKTADPSVFLRTYTHNAQLSLEQLRSEKQEHDKVIAPC